MIGLLGKHSPRLAEEWLIFYQGTSDEFEKQDPSHPKIAKTPSKNPPTTPYFPKNRSSNAAARAQWHSSAFNYKNPSIDPRASGGATVSRKLQGSKVLRGAARADGSATAVGPHRGALALHTSEASSCSSSSASSSPVARGSAPGRVAHPAHTRASAISRKRAAQRKSDTHRGPRTRAAQTPWAARWCTYACAHTLQLLYTPTRPLYVYTRMQCRQPYGTFC